LYENQDEEDSRPNRRVAAKKPKWQIKNEEEYHKAQD